MLQRNACITALQLHTCRFHVDELSSAHVYLRMPQGRAWDDIPPDTLEDCAQLVKANSIQVCSRYPVALQAPPDYLTALLAATSLWPLFPGLPVAHQGHCARRGSFHHALPTDDSHSPHVALSSLQGNKVDNLAIIYTPVSNLKKTQSMEVGQVLP